MISENKDYSMYEDDDDQIQTVPLKNSGLSVKKNDNVTTDIIISGQRITMINPEYVFRLQRKIAELESKIKIMNGDFEALRNEIRRYRSEDR